MALLKVDLFSRSLMRTVPVTVILPVDNIHDPAQELPPIGKKYKTLYLLHGLYGNHTDWICESRIQSWAQSRSLAVVMPDGENHFYVDCEATGEKYGTFIGEELIELTRRMFPLSGKREDTFLAGLSMGGYGAVRNGLLYGDTFGYLAGLSSALILDLAGLLDDSSEDFTMRKSFYQAIFGDISRIKGSDKDYEALYLQRKASGAPIPKIYLACGTEDYLLMPNRKFRDFLEKEHADFIYEEGPGEHNFDFWNAYLPHVLDWLPLEEEIK